MSCDQIISVIIPSYNEERTIKELLNKVYDTLSSSLSEFQVIIVDDGSKDNSVVIVNETISHFSKGEFSLYKQEKNQGKGAAIRKGLEYATGEYCIIQDADLEYEPEDILKMLDYVKANGLDVLYGSRILKAKGKNKGAYNFFYLGGRLVTLATNIIYFQKITDEPTCYKMFKTNILKKMNLKCNGFEFCPEVTAKAAKMGYKIKEIPISYYPRKIEEGKKISWLDGVEAIWTLLKYRF